MIKAVSDITMTPWKQVYDMNVYEFFNALVFARRYNEELYERSKAK